MKKTFFVIFYALMCLVTLQAQKVTLQDVANGTYRAQSIQGLKPMLDGEHYTQISKDHKRIVKYSFKTGKEVATIFDVATARNHKLKSFDDYIMSPDESLILIQTETKPIYRRSFTAVYYIYNVRNRTLEPLSNNGPQQVPLFSPDSHQIAFVRNNNIYLIKLLFGNSESQVTKDGEYNKVLNGIPDWVYEEEFACRDGFRWSPDGQYIAYWQSDTKGTGVFDIINNVDSIYPTILHFPYPKAGSTNSAVKVGYLPAAGGATTWIEIPGDPRNNYIPRMEFIPGSNELFIQQMNRPQNTNKVWIARIGSPTPQNIFTDTDAAWLDTNDNIQWLKDNTWFTWESERNGWRHLYRISRDGKEIQPVTKGDFDYISPVGTDLQKGLV